MGNHEELVKFLKFNENNLIYILSLDFCEFWKQIINNNILGPFIEQFLQSCDLFRLLKFSNLCHKLVEKSINYIFLLFKRISVNYEEVECKICYKLNLPEYQSILDKQSLFEIPEILLLCKHLGKTHKDQLKKSINSFFLNIPNCYVKCENLILLIHNFITEILTKCDSFINIHGSCVSNASSENADQFHFDTLKKEMYEIVYTIYCFCEFFPIVIVDLILNNNMLLDLSYIFIYVL